MRSCNGGDRSPRPDAEHHGARNQTRPNCAAREGFVGDVRVHARAPFAMKQTCIRPRTSPAYRPNRVGVSPPNQSSAFQDGNVRSFSSGVFFEGSSMRQRQLPCRKSTHPLVYFPKLLAPPRDSARFPSKRIGSGGWCVYVPALSPPRTVAAYLSIGTPRACKSSCQCRTEAHHNHGLEAAPAVCRRPLAQATQHGLISSAGKGTLLASKPRNADNRAPAADVAMSPWPGQMSVRAWRKCRRSPR